MHILIVEDEKNIRQELKILLENSLYQVTALEDFSDVAAVVLRTIPDLVLLDLSLPEESGFEICAKIRAASEVPVIFVTGKTDSMDELTGMLKGADDYITKPSSFTGTYCSSSQTIQKAGGDINLATQGSGIGLSKGMCGISGTESRIDQK